MSLLHIGSKAETLTAGKEAIIEILKAAGTEAAQVAAMTTLGKMITQPTTVTISDCAFYGQPEGPVVTKKAKARK